MAGGRQGMSEANEVDGRGEAIAAKARPNPHVVVFYRANRWIS